MPRIKIELSEDEICEAVSDWIKKKGYVENSVAEFITFEHKPDQLGNTEYFCVYETELEPKKGFDQYDHVVHENGIYVPGTK